MGRLNGEAAADPYRKERSLEVAALLCVELFVSLACDGCFLSSHDTVEHVCTCSMARGEEMSRNEDNAKVEVAIEFSQMGQAYCACSRAKVWLENWPGRF
jgi:hypothetical protein